VESRYFAYFTQHYSIFGILVCVAHFMADYRHVDIFKQREKVDSNVLASFLRDEMGLSTIATAHHVLRLNHSTSS